MSKARHEVKGQALASPVPTLESTEATYPTWAAKKPAAEAPAHPCAKAHGFLSPRAWVQLQTDTQEPSNALQPHHLHSLKPI